MRNGNNKEEVEGLVFRALSESSRRKILDLVIQEPGIKVSDICDSFATSRFAVMKHLNVLEEAGIVRREKDGNSRRIYVVSENIRVIRNRCKDWI